MCWNQHVSLNTFLFSTFVLCLMIYNDKYTPYKTTIAHNVYFYIFIFSFASMQFVEYLLWKNINNEKKVQTISTYGQILVILQPIVSLLMVKNAILKWAIIAVYSITAFSIFNSSKNHFKTTVLNGHLKWNWMPVSYTAYAMWVACLLFSFILNGEYNYVLAALFLFLITYWSNYANGTAGSLWCWSINVFMLYFAVKLLIILPFQSHGVC
jgi:hypothetical protein